MIFPKNERVVCVNLESDEFKINSKELVLGETYTIKGISKINKHLTLVVLYEFQNRVFTSDFFITLLEYRKLKLEKLKKNVV